MVTFELRDIHYTHFENGEIEVDSNFIPRCGEIVNFHHYKEQVGVDVDNFNFMVYEVEYYPKNKTLHAIVRCRQWFEQNEIEFIFGDEFWWSRNKCKCKCNQK